MNTLFGYIVARVVAGLLLILPIYLALLLLFKALSSVGHLVKPFTHLLPEWVPAEQVLSLLLVLAICFLIGVCLMTQRGRNVRHHLEERALKHIPGYELLRSLTLQVAGKEKEGVWQPALAEIEEAQVPAFIIESLDDGRYVVFVPSIPTPFAGAVYILDPHRVQPVDLPFPTAVKVISKWGSGAGEFVKARKIE